MDAEFLKILREKPLGVGPLDNPLGIPDNQKTWSSKVSAQFNRVIGIYLSVPYSDTLWCVNKAWPSLARGWSSCLRTHNFEVKEWRPCRVHRPFKRFYVIPKGVEGSNMIDTLCRCPGRHLSTSHWLLRNQWWPSVLPTRVEPLREVTCSSGKLNHC